MKILAVLLLGMSLQQMNHRAFTSVEGAPTDSRALAQTIDGSLWIGGGTGLTRFDGARFVPYPQPGEEPLPSTNVAALIAAPDGGLWIGFRLGGAAFLKDGRVTRFDERDGLPSGSLDQFAWDRDGSLWAATREGLAHLRARGWEKVADPRLAIPYGLLVDRAGTLWVATPDGVFALVRGESRFREVARVGFTAGRAVLAAAPDGSIWAAPTRGLIRIDSPQDPRPNGFVTIRGMSGGGPLLFDHSGNLWASDPETSVLLRGPAADLPHEGQPQQFVLPETFVHADGLNSGAVYAALEDRERNIWIATTTGLDRFSQSNVVHDPTLPCARAAFALERGAFVAGDNGSLWIACTE